ncbi:MAG: translation initiation factor IF-2 [Candidatus Peregrinibacteria bacterium]|nr:translation initiation factor IF-2 [Candidatus Peregrinibacteria bacterium]
MRLVQVAKVLGMTGQQLRKELSGVNFGVKPTDREIPDNLAKGIIRFYAAKLGLKIDLEAVTAMDDDGEEEGEEQGGAEAPATPTTQEAEAATPAPAVSERAAPAQSESLNVLRKLSLEGVPKEAIVRQEQQDQKKALTKAEREERSREQRAAQVLQKGPQHTQQEQIKKKEGVVLLPELISVKELAEKTGIQVPLIIQTLMKNGVMATITQSIDFDTAMIVATELGVTVDREQRSANVEDLLMRNLSELLKDEPEKLLPRPPVVVVMGHVDHGKTALLDAIRQTDVVSGEAGGITQHIGAYQVEHPSTSSGQATEMRKITFLDTPGHEAFTAMRARGAQVTDIAIILVSAEEGVKATTVEAIHHAKEAEVPIIAVISKIDKERADPERVKGELAAAGLQPEAWGGSVPVVLCSAVTKKGIPELLDHILLIADINELKANPNRPAVATVIESHLDTSLGPLATVIVNTGTLKMGEILVCASSMGRVKAMIDAHGVRLTEVGPSGPVRVSGLDAVTQVGDILQVVASEKEARVLATALRAGQEQRKKHSFADLVSRLSEGRIKQLKVVLKADAQGSLEAIQEALRQKSEGMKVGVKVIHAAVGAVSESDVMMTAASEGMVLAFHAPVSPDVQRTADREGVKVRQYTVLYDLLEEVTRLLEGLVEPEEEESILGHLEVRGVFLSKKSEQIIGGKVMDGMIKRVSFRLQRGGAEIGTGRITSLKHVDKDIKEAKEGSECGMRVESSVPIEVGDTLEAYVRELKRKGE